MLNNLLQANILIRDITIHDIRNVILLRKKAELVS